MSFRLRMIYLKISQSKSPFPFGHCIVRPSYASEYLIGIFKLFLRSEKVNLPFASSLSFVKYFKKEILLLENYPKNPQTHQNVGLSRL
jgi:hypothetical protein